jgi:hypothetical protein
LANVRQQSGPRALNIAARCSGYDSVRATACCYANWRWTAGRVRLVNGVLAVLAAKREGWPAVVVPVDNVAEASLVEGVEVWGPYLSSSPFPGLSRRLDSTRQLFCYTAYFACR